jgi:hypothetical protein
MHLMDEFLLVVLHARVGQYIAAASFDGFTTIWQRSTRDSMELGYEVITVLDGHENEVRWRFKAIQFELNAMLDFEGAAVPNRRSKLLRGNQMGSIWLHVAGIRQFIYTKWGIRPAPRGLYA